MRQASVRTCAREGWNGSAAKKGGRHESWDDQGTMKPFDRVPTCPTDQGRAAQPAQQKARTDLACTVNQIGSPRPRCPVLRPAGGSERPRGHFDQTSQEDYPPHRWPDCYGRGRREASPGQDNLVVLRSVVPSATKRGDAALRRRRRRQRLLSRLGHLLAQPSACSRIDGLAATVLDLADNQIGGEHTGASARNFYKVEKDGLRVELVPYTGNNLDKACRIFERTVKHRSRIRLTIRQRMRVLEEWPRHETFL